MSQSSHPSPSQRPGDPPETPLHPDPEVAATLAFDPVPRQIKRPDGWTPERQREFIRHLAVSGSPQQACVEMGKNVTGIEAVYKVPCANSFRAAWDEAVRIGRRAQGIDGGPPHLGPVPGIKRRNPADYSPPTRGRGRWPDPEPVEPADDAKAKLAVVERLFTKFVGKVQQEREARLAGKIAAADFYLRQVTFFEVTFDLMAEGIGDNPFQLMHDLRRAGHGVIAIAATPMSRLLDDMRRETWAEMAGEPPRPLPPLDAYFDEHDSYTLQPPQCLGQASAPPPGVDPDKWSEMDMAEQKGVLAEVYRKAAEAQVVWERESAEAKPGE